MKKGLTEIVYILDRSGSMEGMERDTIGGFNSMIKKQRDTGKEALVSTILFDDRCKVLHDRLPIKKVEEMSEKDYYVGGTTALLDAVGGAIRHMGNVHKYARPEDRPEKTIFVITTDGMENASRKYSYEKVHEMIQRQQKKYGWEFIFVGANIDSYREANKFGIIRENVVNYVCDSVGTGTLYRGVSEAVCSVMRANSVKEVRESLRESNWACEIREDYKIRGEKHGR